MQACLGVEPACVWNVKHSLAQGPACRSSGCRAAIPPSKGKMTCVCLCSLCTCGLISAFEITRGPGERAEFGLLLNTLGDGQPT